MIRNRKTLADTLYIYTTPEVREFAISQAKKEQTSGGVSGFVTDLITARMKRKARVKGKKDVGQAS